MPIGPAKLADGLPGLPRHIVLYDTLVDKQTPEESTCCPVRVR